MSFTETKLKVLSDLLRQYNFSDGFTFYQSRINESDSGIRSENTIYMSGIDPFSKKTLSGEGNLALYPIVFDLFDVTLDKVLSVNDLKFSKKVSLFSSHKREDDIVDFLEKAVLEKAVELRNKIIHNDIVMNEDDGYLTLPSGNEYQVADFGILNRLVFNISFKLLNNKPYSQYEKCAALALYKKVFGCIQSEKIDSLYENGEIIDMNVCPRHYRDLSGKTICSESTLYDNLVGTIESFPDENGAIKFSEGIYSNQTFQLKLNETDIIVPAELINSNKNLKLNEVAHWLM
ncbi:hypothetical protein [Shewanella scandinavica]|uniref:hypothetical protein n=1 Tax=Shewanella scandinavica TaxID=3063538 RepID=UPI00319942F0